MANLEDRQECQECPSKEACGAGQWEMVGFENCLFWVPVDDEPSRGYPAEAHPGREEVERMRKKVAWFPRSEVVIFLLGWAALAMVWLSGRV